MAAVQPLLVITDLMTRDADSESFRVALDVLKAAAAVKTVCPQGSEELTTTLARRGRRRPVVVGDEETLHAVVEVLHRRHELPGTSLGWVPVGYRGELAVSLGIPREPARAARIVVTGAERWLDLLVDDAGGIAVDSVRVAVGSATGRVGRGPLRTGWGPLEGAATRLVSLAGGGQRTARRLRVEADGTVLTHLGRQVLLVGIGTVTREERPGDQETPPAPGGGFAEVVVSESGGPLGRLGSSVRQLREAGRGAGVQRGYGIHLARARTVTVSGPEFAYDADGVTCGPVALRTWQVKHSAWRLTVPPDG